MTSFVTDFSSPPGSSRSAEISATGPALDLPEGSGIPKQVEEDKFGDVPTPVFDHFFLYESLKSLQLTLKAFLMRADSWLMTPLSSAAVLHCRIDLITSRSFKFDIY